MKELYAALAKAQKQFSPALKTASNPHFKHKYADLANCVEAVIDALNANGLFLCQSTHECEDGVIVETVFLHESGQQFSAGKFHVPATKQDAQGYGSALTYARRYSLMAACGIAPEDDDGNAAKKPSDDAYQEFERQHLEPMREAALRGVKALQDAFSAMPKSDMTKRFWANHSKALKDAANSVALG